MRINVLDLDEHEAELLINQLEQLEKQAAQSTEQMQEILRERGNLSI